MATLVGGAVLLESPCWPGIGAAFFRTGLSIASVLYGSLLGVFLLGVLTRRWGNRPRIFGMAAGLATMLYVSLRTSIRVTWYVPIGVLGHVCGGLAASLIWKETRAKA